MDWFSLNRVVVIITLVLSINYNNGISAKSLANSQGNTQQDSVQHQQQPNTQAYQYSPQQHQYPYQQHVSQQAQPNTGGNDPNYPAYPDDTESYDYQSSSSEEIMPVKNSEFVPVEDYSTDQNNGTEDGYIPQRQVNLQQFWQNQGMFQPNDKVTDNGQIKVATYSNANNNNYYNQEQVDPSSTHQLQQQQQYQQQMQHYYEHYQHEELPSSSVAPVDLPEQPPNSVALPKVKKSNASKLIVVAGRNGEGKIAVVRDKLRAKRERRSMMTLSREDENDTSEYDDVTSSQKVSLINKRNSTSTSIITSSTTLKP